MTPQEAFIKVQSDPNAATRGDFALAMLYLSERLCVAEKTLADRTRIFVPPTPKEVEEYAKTIKFVVDGRKFCDYYETRGWMIGKSKMKSWKAALRTWKSNDDSQPKTTGRIPDNLRNDHGL